MTTTTVGRFQLREYNELTYPHKCGTCGSFSGDNGKKYIDTGCFIEYYGTVYFCTECYKDGASILGLTESKSNQSSEDRITELTAVVTTLISENRNLRDAVDTLRRCWIDRIPVADPDNDDNTAEQSNQGISDRTGQREDDSVGSPVEITGAGKGGETRPVEPVNVGGSKSLPDNDPHIGLNIFDI